MKGSRLHEHGTQNMDDSLEVRLNQKQYAQVSLLDNVWLNMYFNLDHQVLHSYCALYP